MDRGWFKDPPSDVKPDSVRIRFLCNCLVVGLRIFAIIIGGSNDGGDGL